MGQPSNAKPSGKRSSLRPSALWKGKASSPNPNLNPNPNPRRPKQRLLKTQDHAAYHPPRLQDLQFQNRLKAFRHFPERQDPLVATGYIPMLDGSVASASAFPAPTCNTSRKFLADARVSGLQFEFPTQSAYGPLVFPGKSSRFFDKNPRLMNAQGQGLPFPAGTQLYAGIPDAGLVPRVSNSLASFIFGSNASGTASAFRKPSGKGNTPFKRFKAFRRPRRALRDAKNHLAAPAAPRNTTSFLMRAKKAGGITSFVSPSPVTPAVLPTPVSSPFVPFSGLADEANHDWGVDGYGSMNGLIRLRSLDLGSLDYGDNNDIESEEERGTQSVQQMEQRLDHDVRRFVMTYPASRHEEKGQDSLDVQRVDDQDSHIAHLEEENMDLKGRLYSVQQEIEDLRRRLRVLKGLSCGDEAEEEASPVRSVTKMSCL